MKTLVLCVNCYRKVEQRCSACGHCPECGCRGMCVLAQLKFDPGEADATPDPSVVAGDVPMESIRP